MSAPRGLGSNPAGATGTPVVDVIAVLAVLQDQIDDRTATVEAQQRTLDAQARGPHPGRPTGVEPAAGTGNGPGRR